MEQAQHLNLCFQSTHVFTNQETIWNASKGELQEKHHINLFEDFRTKFRSEPHKVSLPGKTTVHHSFPGSWHAIGTNY